MYLGYLMVEPQRHVNGWGDLTDQEAAALGVLVNNLARVLKTVAKAAHVYSFVLGDEVPTFTSTSFLATRAPRDYWGVRASQLPDAPRGGIDEITAVCDRLRRALSHINLELAQRRTPDPDS